MSPTDLRNERFKKVDFQRYKHPWTTFFIPFLEVECPHRRQNERISSHPQFIQDTLWHSRSPFSLPSFPLSPKTNCVTPGLHRMSRFSSRSPALPSLSPHPIPSHIQWVYLRGAISRTVSRDFHAHVFGTIWSAISAKTGIFFCRSRTAP